MQTPVELTKGGSDVDAINYSTASITPTAGRTILAAIQWLDLGSAKNGAGLSCSGCGFTWTAVRTAGGNANEPSLKVFRASSASGTPTTGPVTFAGVVTAGQTADGAAWIVVEIPETDISVNDGVIQDDAEGGTFDDWTSGVLALGAFRDAQSGTCFFQAAYDSAGGAVANAAGAGFTELSEVTQAAGGDTLTLSFNYAAGNVATATGSVSAANDRLLGVMVEIGHVIPRPAAATGTGVANDATTAVASGSGDAGATGAAAGPGGSVSVNPAAGAATGQAFDATVTTGVNAQAGTAVGVGAANDATSQVAPTAGQATAVGAANDTTAALSSDVGDAGATGAAAGPGGSVDVHPGAATATGTANDATTLTGTLANAGSATGAGVADGPTTTVASGTGAAGATGAAAGPGSAVEVHPSTATGSGVANNATATTAAAMTANAGTATGTGTAYDATVTVVGVAAIFVRMSLTGSHQGGMAATGARRRMSVSSGPSSGMDADGL